MNPATDPKEGMSFIVKTVSHWLKPFILLFGIYVIIYGHLTPGGGFSGGIIVACAFILVMLAEGKRVAMQDLSEKVASKLDCVGALIFYGVGLIGLLLGGAFLINFFPLSPDSHFKLFSSGIIPICNIGVGLKVGASLFLVFACLAVLRVVPRQPTDSSAQQPEGE